MAAVHPLPYPAEQPPSVGALLARSEAALRAVCGLPVLEVLARQEHAPERGRCRRCAGLAHPAATVTEPAGSADNAGNQEG